VAVTGGAPGTRPGRPAAHGASFGPATTASGVLRNAALAALQLPGGAPNQFVYTKLYRYHPIDGLGGDVVQTWVSVGGTRLGLQDPGRNDMTTSYLTPAQRAALYRLLAQTPGLTVVPHVTNVKGQTGVGVRSGVYKTSIYTIFSRTTYTPLGMNWTEVVGPAKGTYGGEVLLKTAIVTHTGPLP
jgi:hypothetical protein